MERGVKVEMTEKLERRGDVKRGRKVERKEWKRKETSGGEEKKRSRGKIRMNTDKKEKITTKNGGEGTKRE